MRSRVLWAAAVLSTAVVAGGWFVQRGLFPRPRAAHASAPRLFAQVMTRVQREYVDTIPDSTLYLDAARGAVAELDDPGSVYVPASSIAQRPDTLQHVSLGEVADTARRAAGVSHVQMLMNATGYAALSHLSDATAADVRRVVDSLTRAGARRLVLDLRGVTDGGLPQAVALSRLFLNRGQVILRVRGRRPMDSATYSAADAQPWPALRVAVLSDSTTMGAAEVVCGALQDHDRATIVGSPTIGVGGTQTVFHLGAGGALALTTGAWFTPSGRPIEAREDRQDGKPRKPPMMHTDAGRPVPGGGGITPDVAVSAISLVPAGARPVAQDPVVRAALAALAKPIA